MLNTDINVQTPSFDGPLALLLHLIQKEEMDIRELDLVIITGQYLRYLSYMKELNFDIAGDYLYLAATLIFLKSKNAVSLEEENEQRKLSLESSIPITSQEDLIRRLEELAHFQKMSKALWALPKKGHEVFVKPKINRKTIIDSILTPIELQELSAVMIEFFTKKRRSYTVIKRDRLSIKEKLIYLKESLKVGQEISLNNLLEESSEKSISDIVITFISLLELARLKKVEISQVEAYSDVMISVIKSLSDLDMDQANGFEDEEEEGIQVEIEEQEMNMTSASEQEAPIMTMQTERPADVVIQ